MSLNIPLIEPYYLGSDKYQFILKKKVAARKKDGSIAYRSISYTTDLDSMFNRLKNLLINDSDAQTLLELKTVLLNIDTGIVRLMQELHPVVNKYKSDNGNA